MHDTKAITKAVQHEAGSSNKLFPVFLKLETLRLLIVGGGNVAEEKLNAVLQNAPATQITIVALKISSNIRELADTYASIQLSEKEYDHKDLLNADIVIAAVNDITTSEIIRRDAHAARKLVNVADKPALCDFYLGSIVQKGNLKIGISTNGKSPTVAKRLKQVLNESIPNEFDEVLSNISQIRDTLKGDFSSKVVQLNKLTEGLVSKKKKSRPSITVLRMLAIVALVFTCMIAGYLLFTFTSLNHFLPSFLKHTTSQ
jgi:siroheme synthase-like protein